METSYLKTLELDKIIARAAEGCVCKESREKLLAIEPQCDPDEVRYALEQTDAINSLLIKNGSPRFGGVEGVSQLAARAVKGGVLSMGELLMVAGALRNFQNLVSWYGSSEHDALPTDDLFYALAPQPDTGFLVHSRYDLSGQGAKRAGLTEEQKKLFSYFVPVRGMSEQLVDVLEQDRNCTNRRGTSNTGNLLIVGNKGNGKTVLAVDVVKAIQKQRKIRQGRVAIITGEALNKKKISDIIAKLYGGALIIEKAGKLSERTVAKLNKAMEKDTGEMLIVLEEQRKPLDRILSSNREFRKKFTSRLEVPIFVNDELVTFGQTYAQENGYRIDEMGILALYSRIDAMQREDHAVTVAEVKDIMDEAMSHSQKVSAKKLVKRVLGKNTDDADRIILTEKDFNI